MAIDRLVPNPHKSLNAQDPLLRTDNRACIKRIGLLTTYAKGHETVYGLVAGMVTLALSLVLLRLSTTP
ncbi:hypothetical protein [Xanthomonas hyacinthi]|uniref:hypothetical protein n=1 Tax=Xanthomonas hyacinthi TaxID=56455 RepID=UPI00062D05BC|nr:hypothetical protein Y886_18995 [Xanthomonas hyacinthi DSM 19077]